MTWEELIQSVTVTARGGEVNPVISDIVYDSRAVKPGTVFVAIPGFVAHGDTFIADAVAQGAAAVVSEHAQPESGVPWIQVADPRKVLAALAVTLWNIDFNTMVTVGITGTNGKTTTAGFYHTLFKNI